MQNGSLMKTERRNGQSVWEFRWRDRTSGRAVYCRIVLGTTQQLGTAIEARETIAGIILEMNVNDIRSQMSALTISQLAEHYRRRELSSDNTWKTYSTKQPYESYLKRWILPKWRDWQLSKIKPIEVELWLRQLPLARGSRAKIRCRMSVLFNHARRYELFDDNPIELVRQSAKRRRVPDVLSIDEISRLLAAVDSFSRMLIFLDATTGLRQSELFGLRWGDLNFESGEINVPVNCSWNDQPMQDRIVDETDSDGTCLVGDSQKVEERNSLLCAWGLGLCQQAYKWQGADLGTEHHA